MSLRDLSDNELIERCRYRRYEEKLQGTDGCAIAIIVATAAAAVVILGLIYESEASLSKDPWWLTLSSTLIIGVAGFLTWLFVVTISYFSLVFIISARPSRYHEEARRRFLPPSGSTLKQMMEQLLNECKRPTWILGFSGHAMPRGGQTSILVQRSSGLNDEATIEIWQSPMIFLGEVDPRPVVKHTCSQVRKEDLTTLEKLVASLTTTPLSNVISTVRDGLPCTVVAAINGHPSIQSGQCNLCVGTHIQSEPAVLLGHALMALAELYVDELFLIGSSDSE